MVIDDTTNMRSQCLDHVMHEMGVTQTSQKVYESVNSYLNGMMHEMEYNFNVLYINQVADEYENNEKTGKWTGKYYPANLVHSTNFNILYDVKVDEDGTEVPFMSITALRNKWRFGKTTRPTDILFDDESKMKFTTILEALHIDKSMW